MNKSWNRNQNWRQMTKTVETQKKCETESESSNDAIRKIPLHPRGRLKWKQKVANFKCLWSIFQVGKQVFLSNYKIIYGIDEKDEILNSLVQQNAKDYYIYKRICKLAVESFVVWSEKSFNVEIDTERNWKLLENMTSILLTKC